MKLPAIPWLCGLAVLAGCAATPPSSPAPASAGASLSPPPASAGPVWTSAATLDAACASGQARIRAERQVVKTRERTEAGVLTAVNRLFSELDTDLGIMSLMANVHPDKAARDRAERCEEGLRQVAVELSLDRSIYDAVAGVDASRLDADAKRFVEKLLRDLRRAGVDKDEDTRAKIKALNAEMIQTGQAFSRNIREDVRSIEVEPKELDGLPEDFIRAHKANAAGKIVLTTNYPDFFPVETYARSEDVRKRLAVAFLSRAVPANDAELKKLLALRSESAKLLGYPSWAEYQAEDKMVKSAAAIQKFIDDLAKLARPRMKKEIADLLVRKRQDDEGAKAIEVWDRFYYVDQVRSARYGFDTKEVRAYFEFNRVVQGLFELYGEIFGLRFERAKDVPVWHESVLAYRVFSGDEPVGRFYLDLHPREGKFGHAAMFNMVTGLAGGPAPEAALVCNFPDPSKSDGPALMEHGDVRTFFHEFGHLIHHLMARSSKWVNESGTSVEWDFVEAPSQLLEEWVWDPAVLARFARHYATNAPIPAELVAKMRAAEEFGKGMGVLRQLKFAAMSYELHAKDPRALDLVAFTKDVDARYSPFPYVPGTHEYASFGHLEGYSSMYYTYQWSLVMAKDIFTRFSKAGLLDLATAREYREKILVPGGRKDAAELMKDFLGRDASLDAYRAWLERDG